MLRITARLTAFPVYFYSSRATFLT